MRSLFVLGLVLLVTGCIVVPPGGDGGQASAKPDCKEYTLPVTVGGQPEQAAIRACPQSDGTWQVTQDTPGLPQQVYALVPPPAPYDSGIYDPWLYEPYWFGATVIFVPRHHHYDHDHDHHSPTGHSQHHG